jgi:dCMP deaminase
MAEWKGGLDTKPDWDDYYMSMAYLVSQRSVDESTVHGAVLVSADNRVLSIGYNGPIRGSEIDPEELRKRPNKYWYMIHAEENCIINYHGSHSDLIGATMYITGEPCHICLLTILQKGIRRIIHGTAGSKCLDEQDREAKEHMLDSIPRAEIGFVIGSGRRVKEPILFKRSPDETKKVQDLLHKTLNYIDYKEKDNG